MSRRAPSLQAHGAEHSDDIERTNFVKASEPRHSALRDHARHLAESIVMSTKP